MENKIARLENKKNMREMAELLWNMPMGNGELTGLEDVKCIEDVLGKNVEAGLAGLALVYNRWMREGDIRDGQFLANLLGFNKVDISMTGNNLPIFVGNLEDVDDTDLSQQLMAEHMAKVQMAKDEKE